ncbi:hypothetical protein D3C81_1113860 [compost metagenome]
MADVIGIGQRVFRETTVHRIAAVLLRFAQRFPAAQTVLAIATRRVQPRNADAVAFLDVGDAGTYRDHMANAFVAGNEWRIGLDRPVALHRVQIGVAHATGFDLDQDVARCRARHHHFLDDQRFAELTYDSGLHGSVHACISFYGVG